MADSSGRNIHDGLFFMPPAPPPRTRPPAKDYPLYVRGNAGVTPTLPPKLAKATIGGGGKTDAPSEKNVMSTIGLPNVSRRYENDGMLVNRLRNLYLQARDFKRARYETWTRNYRMVNARGMNQSSSPTPKVSEIYPILSALVGWMTDQDPEIGFVPATDPNSPHFTLVSAIAKDLSDVYNSNWEIADYDGQVKLILWDAFMYNTGILKNVWDAGVDGGMGNVRMRRVDPWAFFIDPYATSMDDAEYMGEVRRLTYDEVCRRYPDARAVLSALGGGMDQIDEGPRFENTVSMAPKAQPGFLPGGNGNWDKYNRGGNTRMRDPNPGYVVYEFWLRENVDATDSTDSNAPVNVHSQWRVVAMCANQIIMNEVATDLWSRGDHPYERYCFDDIGEFYGIALVDHLAQPQLYINRLLSALQSNAELTGNPILLEPAQGNMQRVNVYNKPGQRIPVSGAGGMQNNAPRWLDPPSMPTEVMSLVEFWVSRMENISGLSAIVRGATPNSRNSEGVISSIQEAAFVRIRSALHNLEKMLERCSYKQADLIVENYTEPRIVAIVGAQGSKTARALHGYHFMLPGKDGGEPLKYVLNVRAGSSTPTSRQARIAESSQLYALGAIDDQAILEAYNYNNIPEVLYRLYQKRMAGVFSTPTQRQGAGH